MLGFILHFRRGFKLIRMSSNQGGESGVTIPLQYNNSVRTHLFCVEFSL